MCICKPRYPTYTSLPTYTYIDLTLTQPFIKSYLRFPYSFVIMFRINDNIYLWHAICGLNFWSQTFFGCTAFSSLVYKRTYHTCITFRTTQIGFASLSLSLFKSIQTCLSFDQFISSITNIQRPSTHSIMHNF